jgi:hydrogenase maturation protease
MDQNFSKKILVAGIGNILCCDEGIGIHTIQEMKKLNLDGPIELLDMGTSTMDLISYLDGFETLIVIDAIKAGGVPGTVYRCRLEDLLPNDDGPVSLHDIGLVEALAMANKMGRKIETVIIGVEPKEVKWGMELSEEVRKRITWVIEAVLKECRPGVL